MPENALPDSVSEVLQITQWHSPSSACNFHPTHLYQCYTFCSTINLRLSHGQFVPEDALKFTRLSYALSL